MEPSLFEHFSLRSFAEVVKIPPHLSAFCMEKTSLLAQVRDKAISAKNIRKQGLVPAEFYGHGVDNLTIQVDYNDFRRLYRKAGNNTVIDLEIEGKGKKNVLVHRLDKHPVKDEISYVEFINVRMDEEITAMIPLRLEGQAPAVRDQGAILIQNMDEVEVTCLPAYLPKELVLSVEALVDTSMTLHVSDIVAPAHVKLTSDMEASVASVILPQQEEEAAAPVADVSAVEVTTEKKDEEKKAE